jgi:hypothetical protein
MSTLVNLNKVSLRLLPWAAGFLLAVLTLINFSDSFVAGIFGLLGLLLIISPVNKAIVRLIPKAAPISRPIVKWCLVILFALLSQLSANAAQKSAITNEYLANKEAILSEAASLHKQGKFFDAYYKLLKFEKVIDSDSDFTDLFKIINEDLSKQNAKEASSTSNASNGGGNQNGDALNENAKNYLKTYDKNSFCAGFYSLNLPGASQQSCVAAGELDPFSKQGLDEGSKCTAWVTDNFFQNGIASSFPPKMLEYVNERKGFYASEYARGSAAWSQMTPQDAQFCKTVVDEITKIMANNQ